MLRRHANSFLPLAAVLSSLLVGACSGLSTHTETMDEIRKKEHPSGSILGGDSGLELFGGGKRQSDAASNTGIGVNDLLWRASLDTLSFLPLPIPPDPFGGVIVYDWYTPPETPNERYKVNVFILDRQLRADGVRVSVFRQARDGSNWRDTGADAETAAKLEDAILTRARQMRSAQTNAG